MNHQCCLIFGQLQNISITEHLYNPSCDVTLFLLLLMILNIIKGDVIINALLLLFLPPPTSHKIF